MLAGGPNAVTPMITRTRVSHSSSGGLNGEADPHSAAPFISMGLYSAVLIGFIKERSGTAPFSGDRSEEERGT